MQASPSPGTLTSYPPTACEPGRLVSLDAFRGLAVLGMLVVNNKALGPWTPADLTHASHGQRLHFADLVFPWFLLIVGVALPFAVASARNRGPAAPSFLAKASTRALLLVAIGVLINSSYPRRFLFDIGVLQTIGLAYFFGLLLYHLSPRPRAAAAAGLLIGQWAVLRFVPVPGEGLHPFAAGDNVMIYLARHYLQRFGLENAPVLVPTSALVAIGSLVGDLVRRRPPSPRRTLVRLFCLGAALAVAGLLWSLDLPMLKPLWTASYVVFAAGAGTLVVAALHWSIDLRGRQAWAFPLVVFGRNAIAAFTLPILVNIYIVDGWTWTPPGGPTMSVGQHLYRASVSRLGSGPGGLLYTFLFVFGWWLVFLYMHRKGRFLRV